MEITTFELNSRYPKVFKFLYDEVFISRGVWKRKHWYSLSKVHLVQVNLTHNEKARAIESKDLGEPYLTIMEKVLTSPENFKVIEDGSGWIIKDLDTKKCFGLDGFYKKVVGEAVTVDECWLVGLALWKLVEQKKELDYNQRRGELFTAYC